MTAGTPTDFIGAATADPTPPAAGTGEWRARLARMENDLRTFETAARTAQIGVWECDLRHQDRLSWSKGVYDLFEKPTHPYTRGLLSCIPTAALLASGERLRAIPGNVPSVLSLPPGCTFAPRCPLAADDCRAAVPELVPVQTEHRARCIKVNSI